MAVTEEDVQVVADTTTDVALFLTTAQSIVTTYLVPKILDTTVLDSITLYLAAHLTVLTTEKGGQRRIKIGESDESYRVPGERDIGLAQTRFGQMALMLDYTGTLAGLSANKGLKAEFEVVTS
jgi:hypothetical protein